ncbi:ABC transporter ATP-binding protein [Acuticoccus sp. MNP-M23]|uniref:ABC transporter ATP-binding protein n=1 Tax=Acuticoccus sp. MNP-M23 TaxID=3072793 RepID=UPI0028155CE9|nr:ABC transporter ATP-binding protein [Acuticoccus sp. MNP-M23]WMS44567.1 ABC transporter ATP-binding protein [Acuticoccus sp. MNP-M23]
MENPAKPDPNRLLSVRDLSVGFPVRKQTIDVVQSVSFDLSRGETLCMVGESGSGKSVTARAVMRIEKPGIITGGSILLHGPDGTADDLAKIDVKGPKMRSIRGGRIGLVFQEPMSSLSPVHTIGQQIVETIQLHRDVPAAEARRDAIEALRRVQIPSPETALDQYSFEFSGGMRQRAMIAMALSCEPDILIADEPTTALDVTTQAEILRLVKHLQDSLGMGVIFITHDLGVVAEVADRVAVMFRGKLVETGPVRKLFHHAKTRYARHLIGASAKFSIVGDHARGGTLPAPTAKPLLEVDGLDLTFRKRTGLIFRKTREFHALKNVSFTLHEGENLGIVGESGSGKTTLVRALVGLLKADAGRAVYRSKDGREFDLLKDNALRSAGLNREIRMVFQDPFSSLNPRMTVEQVIAEPLTLEKRLSPAEIRDRVAQLLERVGLPTNVMSRYPHAFSGGQRQRISIARAIAVEPRVIIADEATSALDGSIRSQILDLLFDLQSELGVSYLFVGHDLGVVRYFCDRIAVMHHGELVELGSAATVCQTPEKDYTRRLIAAVPATDPDRRRLLSA